MTGQKQKRIFIDRDFATSMAVALSLGILFWVVDALYEYYQFSTNFHYLLSIKPASIADTLLFNIPPKALVHRITFMLGCIVGGLLIARFLQKHRQSDKALQESENKYRTYISNAPDAIFVLDENGRLMESNRAATAVTGYEMDELVGKKVRDLVDRAERENAEAAMDLLLAKGQAQWEITLRHKAGYPIYVDVNAAKLDINQFIIFCKNITDRKTAETEKQALSEQLRQSQKMEAIGRLAGGVAHDFNNILTGITGYSEIILSTLKEQDPLREEVEQIFNAAQKAAGLTQQLLAFSRKQIITPEICNINDIIANSQKMLSRIIGEDIRLEYRPEKSLWNVKADPGQIDQVLINLAANARDAMPNGGLLRIRTANSSMDHEPSRNPENMITGDFVQVTVTDTGVGIDRETISKIFEPFFSTKDKDKGTGLGLATVYGIVQQNKGHIQVFSEPNFGTTFKIFFPKVSELPERKMASRELLPKGGSETVLLVEDEEMVRALAEKMLARAGYKVLSAARALEAENLIKTHPGQVQLLLTDVVMPGINGMELFQKLKADYPTLKVLFMSGYPEDNIADRGVLDEGLHFIQKPFTVFGLTEKVRRVLDS